MASDGSDQDARYALSKLLQRGTVAEYESEFLMLIKRVTGISKSLLKSFYISGLKPLLQCALLRLAPTTLEEAFSIARIMEARFETIAGKKLNIEEKIDIVLSWPSEEAPPEIKGSLDADEDIGVDAISSAIDCVIHIGESNEVRSKFDEFSDNKERVVEVVVGGGEALGVYREKSRGAAKGERRVLCYVQGSRRRKKKKMEAAIQRRLWDPGIKSVFQDNTLRARGRTRNAWEIHSDIIGILSHFLEADIAQIMIYFPKRTSKRRIHNGQRYGFVRFKFVRDVERMLGQLQKIKIADEWLKVFMAYDRRRNGNMGASTGYKSYANWGNTSFSRGMDRNEGYTCNRDNRRFVDVVNGRNVSVNEKNDEKELNGTRVQPSSMDFTFVRDVKWPGRTIEAEENEINNSLMGRSVVGEVKAMCFLSKLSVLCEEQGLGGIDIKLLGGLEVMVVMENESTVDNVLNDKDHGLRRWLHKIKRGNSLQRTSGRITWINILGIPISC
ncbi:retrotransposon gag protein [Tanacetum coccineum]